MKILTTQGHVQEAQPTSYTSNMKQLRRVADIFLIRGILNNT